MQQEQLDDDQDTFLVKNLDTGLMEKMTADQMMRMMSGLPASQPPPPPPTTEPPNATVNIDQKHVEVQNKLPLQIHKQTFGGSDDLNGDTNGSNQHEQQPVVQNYDLNGGTIAPNQPEKQPVLQNGGLNRDNIDSNDGASVISNTGSSGDNIDSNCGATVDSNQLGKQPVKSNTGSNQLDKQPAISNTGSSDEATDSKQLDKKPAILNGDSNQGTLGSTRVEKLTRDGDSNEENICSVEKMDKPENVSVSGTATVSGTGEFLGSQVGGSNQIGDLGTCDEQVSSQGEDVDNSIVNPELAPRKQDIKLAQVDPRILSEQPTQVEARPDTQRISAGEQQNAEDSPVRTDGHIEPPCNSLTPWSSGFGETSPIPERHRIGAMLIRSQIRRFRKMSLARSWTRIHAHIIVDHETERYAEQVAEKSEKCKELERENISLRVTETSNGPSPLEPNDKVASETMTKRQVIKLLQLRGIDPALVFGETKRKTWGEDETYGKYFKMLAEKVPRASVEKEMQDGGLDITVLNNNPGDLVPASAQKNALLEKSGPSLKDDERYGKYFKMLAVKVPRGAIEVKMRNEGLDPAFLDLDPESPAPDVAGAAKTEISGPSSRKTTNNEKKLKDDPRYAPFLKMIAVKVPKGAVISKMQSKGLDPKYLDMDPETTMIPQEKEEDKTAAKSGDDASKVRLKDDPNYGPFFKMLAVKVPKQAIVNKMLAKGLDPEYLDKDPGSFAPQPQVEEQGDGQTSGVKLKDDPDYGPFFKMLAVKVPKQAIVNKMLAKGLDPAYLDKDPESFAPQPVSKEAPLDRVKLKDDPKYGPFFKMLAVKVPKQAVANKMLAKGLDPTYLDKDPESFAPQPVAPTKKDVKDVKLKDDPRYGPFFKMLAVKVPKQAVVNKLLAKGLDPKYLDMDPDSPAPASEPPEGGTQPGSGPIVMLKDDKRYGPFFKMLAVKVPKPAIINKMKNKGLDPKYIDMDPESPAPPEPQAAMTKLKDDKRYGPFFKMLAVKVPKPAVINKMVNKGLDPKYLDMDPESPAPPESGASAAATPAPPKPPIKKPDKIVRRKLHWRKVTKQALEKNEKCVWNTCDRFVFEQREINEMTLCFAVNISEQERQKEREKAAKAAESGQGKGDQASAASKPAAKKVEKKILLDTMRSNNISIVLSRMKGVTAAVVRKCVCSLDIDEDEVSIEDLRSVLNLMPTPEEENVLKAYKGERNILGKAEAYFMELMDIPRYKQRVKCFLYKMKFEDLFEDASMDFKMINSACKEILSSKKFCRLLEIVLALGNFMNEGDDAPRTRLAVGFTMDSLSKLRQVKSFQQQTTALHYLVMLIQARQRDIIGFIKSGTDNIRAAASVSLSNALAQLQMLENGFKVLENEHKLVAAIVSNPEKRDNLSEEDKLFFLGLNKFYNLAEKSLEELRQEGNDTEQRFKETLDFLCEDPSTTSEVFFRTLQTFFADFELALNQNDAARQKHLKKERARMERNSKTKKGSVPAKRK